MALAPAGQRRLAQLLGMLGSDHDGEVVNAARAACRLLAGQGQTWTDIVATPSPAAIDLTRITVMEQDAFERGLREGLAQAGASGRSPSWPVFVARCLDHARVLNAWEREFCESFLARGWSTPTVRQRPHLERIGARCGVLPP